MNQSNKTTHSEHSEHRFSGRFDLRLGNPTAGSQLRWAAIGKRREHAASFSEKKDVKESKVESDKVQRAKMSQAFVYAGKMQRAFHVSNMQVIQKFQMPVGVVKCMPTYHAPAKPITSLVNQGSTTLNDPSLP